MTNLLSLKDQFAAYCRSYEGAEEIDVLLRGEHLPGLQRADFLFQDRSIVVEIKGIEGDPLDKAKDFLQKLCKERGIMIFGSVSSEQILARLPDADAQRRKLFYATTNSIDKLFAKANRQIKGTKAIFDLRNAIGVLVFVNEDVLTLSPSMIIWKAHKMLNKSVGAFSRSRYDQIESTLLISNTHSLVDAATKQNVDAPFMSLFQNSADAPSTIRAEAFLSPFLRKWTEKLGLGMVEQVEAVERLPQLVTVPRRTTDR